MVSCNDDVAIVTGGSTGLGREFAVALARRGFVVVLVYLADQDAADAAIESILAANGSALAVRADVTDDVDVERLFVETVAAFGGVDVIVHIDSGGTATMNHQALRHLRDGGAIVNAGNADSTDPEMAGKFRARGITVTAISVGWARETAVVEFGRDDIDRRLTAVDRWRSGRRDRPGQ